MTAIDNPSQHLYVGIPGPSLDARSRELLAADPPGGIILFKRNVVDAEQLLSLVAELRRTVPDAVLAIDAEGGRVDRLSGITGPSPAASLRARGGRAQPVEAGRLLALALRLFDLDLDFAPVVDLDRGEEDNALDGRTFGSRPAAVVGRARGFLRGLQGGGVGGCVKHFPGLGAATRDTHFAPARVELDEAELAVDLEPFAALAPAVGAVMVGHAIYPAYDAAERPASLSAPVVSDVLRAGLGFDGLVVTDDLEMQALGEWGDLPARAEAAFAAGCDALLLCHTLEVLPEVAARLAQPQHFERHRESSARRLFHQRRLRTLRWASDGASRARPADFRERLDHLRHGLEQLQNELDRFKRMFQTHV
ncbi:MAG TPA: beta-N-acetylhexosaminidase [Thermoanaerobaculia bacterium]